MVILNESQNYDEEYPPMEVCHCGIIKPCSRHDKEFYSHAEVAEAVKDVEINEGLKDGDF